METGAKFQLIRAITMIPWNVLRLIAGREVKTFCTSVRKSACAVAIYNARIWENCLRIPIPISANVNASMIKFMMKISYAT